MPRARLRLETPPGFDFRATCWSHGWFDLAPFSAAADASRLEVVLETAPDRVARVSLAGDAGGVRAEIDASAPLAPGERQALRATVASMLRLEENLESFYALTDPSPSLAWVRRRGAGRLLRGASAWEDLVKLLLTTNCSWALTRTMTTALVANLGPGDAVRGRAFPGPRAMAAAPERFYRDVVRCGYRAPYLAALAERVASGDLDPERWRTGTLTPEEIAREISSVKGAGEYVIGNLLRLVGRYDRLALDSWARAKWARLRGRKRASDAAIARAYRGFGAFRGLALWMELTEDWFRRDGWEPK